jgi:hypothetical protein
MLLWNPQLKYSRINIIGQGDVASLHLSSCVCVCGLLNKWYPNLSAPDDLAV